jgi:ribosome-binding factor A
MLALVCALRTRGAARLSAHAGAGAGAGATWLRALATGGALAARRAPALPSDDDDEDDDDDDDEETLLREAQMDEPGSGFAVDEHIPKRIERLMRRTRMIEERDAEARAERERRAAEPKPMPRLRPRQGLPASNLQLRLAGRIMNRLNVVLEDTKNHDDRLRGLVVESVELTRDLRLARIAWRLARVPEGAPADLLQRRRAVAERALTQATGWLRYMVASKIQMKFVPDFRFEYDTITEDREAEMARVPLSMEEAFVPGLFRPASQRAPSVHDAGLMAAAAAHNLESFDGVALSSDDEVDGENAGDDGDEGDRAAGIAAHAGAGDADAARTHSAPARRSSVHRPGRVRVRARVTASRVHDAEGAPS